jgi:hypothetical protein
MYYCLETETIERNNMNIKNDSRVRISVGAALGTPAALLFLTWGGLDMDTSQALTFAVAVSLSSMFVIMGAAFLGAYRFLKNIGVFKGHYNY